MRLSDHVRGDMVLVRDGVFDILAQCVVRSSRRVLTFLDDRSYIRDVIDNPCISCVICLPDLLNELSSRLYGVALSETPRQAFFEIHNDLARSRICAETPSIIGSKCRISSLSRIPDVNCRIGDNVVIEEFVCIREQVEIGDGCVIRAGSVIGSDGFEFKRTDEGDILTVIHEGKTLIGSGVEIKEMCSVHRALFHWDSTTIGSQCKIDAHVHIGHAVKIGKRVMIGSHANIAGNVVIGDDAYIGPGATVSNRLSIGANSTVSLGSVVTKNVDESTRVTGNFAIDHSAFLRDLKRKARG